MKVILHDRDGARAEAYRHGAHVTSWVPAGDGERLFLSADSNFRPDAAIRGGVPVIFPQFANVGPLPKHGFARTSAWELIETARDGDTASFATFRLADTPTSRAIWPHAFIAELTVTVRGAALGLDFSVSNPGDEPIEFTAALHTYLRVDAPHTAVRGLHGLRYRDSTAGGTECTEYQNEVAIRGEVNRIYLDVPGPVEVVEPTRSMHVAMTGFSDVVVWNPGPGSEASLGDMEPGGAARMLCVEAASIGTPVVVAPGEVWRAAQILTAHQSATSRPTSANV